MARTRAGSGPLMRSSRSLVCPQCRASDEANLRLTPPCFHELQVFGVVGRNDALVDGAAGHAHGEQRVALGFGRETCRGIEAGRRTGPERRGNGPAPKQ